MKVFLKWRQVRSQAYISEKGSPLRNKLNTILKLSLLGDKCYIPTQKHYQLTPWNLPSFSRYLIGRNWISGTLNHSLQFPETVIKFLVSINRVSRGIFIKTFEISMFPQPKITRVFGAITQTEIQQNTISKDTKKWEWIICEIRRKNGGFSRRNYWRKLCILNTGNIFPS